MLINKTTVLLCALIISLGILGAGLSIGKGMYLVRKTNRTITVKGLAERNIKADLGVWEINFREVGNDLVQIDQRLRQDREKILNFLLSQGFTQAEINNSHFRVEDRLANIYSTNNSQASTDLRYVVTTGMRVRTTKVEQLQSTLQHIDKLLEQGIPLTFDAALIAPNPSFYFTQLDVIRAAMLADATRSARAVANQFAEDAHIKIGSILRASQGVFQIASRDTNSQSAETQIEQKVRLVTTIDYELR